MLGTVPFLPLLHMEQDTRLLPGNPDLADLPYGRCSANSQALWGPKNLSGTECSFPNFHLLGWAWGISGLAAPSPESPPGSKR